MELISNWAKGIIVFLLISALLKNLSAGKKYRQYIRMFSGMILIILVISPVINLFDTDMTFIDRFKQYSKLESLKDESVLNKNGEEYRNRYIIKEYENYMAEEIKKKIQESEFTVLDIAVVAYMDENNFGAIKEINVKLQSGINTKSNVKKIDVNPIVIGEDSTDSQVYSEKGGSTKQMESINLLKNTLSDFYNVNIGNINITIREGKDGE